MSIKKFGIILGKVLSLILMIIIFQVGLQMIFTILARALHDGKEVSGNLEMVLLLLTTSGGLLASYIFIKFIWKKDFAHIWLVKEGFSRNLFQGYLLGFFLTSLFVGSSLLLGIVEYQGLNISFLPWILPYLIAFSIQSCFEEVLIRGILTRTLLEKWGKINAILLPSLFFGLLHCFNPSVTVLSTANTALVGILFAVMLFYRDNIAFPWGVHGAWNFFLGPFYGFIVSGLSDGESLLQFKILNSPLAGGEYGPEGSVLTTILLVVSIFIFNILEGRKGRIKNG